MNRDFQTVKYINKKKTKKEEDLKTIEELKRIIKLIQETLLDKNSWIKDYQRFRVNFEENLKKINDEIESTSDEARANMKPYANRVMYFHKGKREENSIDNQSYNGVHGLGILFIFVNANLYEMFQSI